ncbi:hypothetical protein I3843_14G116500 [Carya illinoinensis]|nr:hypothetical protein I3843_14G116500 [Carya illinoinensis]
MTLLLFNFHFRSSNGRLIYKVISSRKKFLDKKENEEGHVEQAHNDMQKTPCSRQVDVKQDAAAEKHKAQHRKVMQQLKSIKHNTEK